MIPMAHVSFDTLKFVEKLTVAGISLEQAKAFSEAQKEVFDEVVGESGVLATKTDVFELKTEVTRVETNLKAEVARVETGLKAEIARVETSLKADIAKVTANINLLNWMMGFLLTGVGALIIKAFFS